VRERQKIASFTQHVFDTVVTGSRLEGEVKFVRLLSPTLAVMHLDTVGLTVDILMVSFLPITILRDSAHLPSPSARPTLVR
jgi:hypothetical protein